MFRRVTLIGLISAIMMSHTAHVGIYSHQYDDFHSYMTESPELLELEFGYTENETNDGYDLYYRFVANDK